MGATFSPGKVYFMGWRNEGQLPRESPWNIIGVFRIWRIKIRLVICDLRDWSWVSVGFTYRRWWLWDNRIYILPSVTLVVRTSFVLLLVFDLCSWHTAPETLPCSLWITEVSCSNRVTQALCGSWMRSGHQKGQAIIRGLELSVPPILLWREKGKIGINDGSFPCDEAS